MKYEESELPDGGSRAVIEFDKLDFMGFIGSPLDAGDKMVVDKCKKSGRVSDKLLALVIFARKIEMGNDYRR